jgi:hypothetical protein
LCANLARKSADGVNAPRNRARPALIAYVPRTSQTPDIAGTQAEQCGKADSSAIRSGFALNLNPPAANGHQPVHQSLGGLVKSLIVSTC